MMPEPKIIYVPGLLPKPPEDVHRAALLRCLAAGIARIDSEIAETIDVLARQLRNRVLDLRFLW